jgi:ABC-type antimicrobial peptide transport system permease subunit
VPLLQGRPFEAADNVDAPPVAIVNRSLAELAFPAGDAIGQTLILDGARREIVGVSADVFQGDVENLGGPEIYLPLQQSLASTLWIVARTRSGGAEILPSLAAAVGRFDPDLVLSRTATLEQLRADDMGSERRMLQLMGAFAAASILICTIGLYGLISYSVTQRTRELGVRIALGAGTGAVRRMVLLQGVRLAAIGGVAGTLGALTLLPLMRSLLFRVSPADPLTLAAVAVLACALGGLAAYLPARRATRVNPINTLGDG